MEEIVRSGMGSNRISIETLGYPFEWIEDIVEESGFSICLDIGHILTHGQDLRAYLEKYLPKTSIIHLYGFQNGPNHLGIDRLPESALELIFSHLRNYQGIVSLEVFSMDDLKRSLIMLEEKWEKR
jgi:sugar phosphate isomerase/epimerase